MAHHQGHIFLGKIIKGCPFQEYPAYEFMSDFDAAFLVRTLRVTVENTCPASSVPAEFNSKRICEFTSAVGQDNWKQAELEILVRVCNSLQYKSPHLISLSPSKLVKTVKILKNNFLFLRENLR